MLCCIDPVGLFSFKMLSNEKYSLVYGHLYSCLLTSCGSMIQAGWRICLRMPWFWDIRFEWQWQFFFVFQSPNVRPTWLVIVAVDTAGTSATAGRRKRTGSAAPSASAVWPRLRVRIHEASWSGSVSSTIFLTSLFLAGIFPLQFRVTIQIYSQQLFLWGVLIKAV